MDDVRTAPAPPTRWVPIKEACEILGLSDDTVRRRIKDGVLPARKETMPSGTRWLIEVPVADEILTQHERAADAPPTHAEVVASLQKVIANLEREREEFAHQLRTREREVAELHVLLQVAHKSQALLPPPQDYRIAEATPTNSARNADAEPMQSGRRPFWKRLLNKST